MVNKKEHGNKGKTPWCKNKIEKGCDCQLHGK